MQKPVYGNTEKGDMANEIKIRSSISLQWLSMRMIQEREYEIRYISEQTHWYGTYWVDVNEVGGTGLGDYTTSTTPTWRYSCKLHGADNSCGSTGSASVDHPVGSIFSALLQVWCRNG